MRPGPAFLLAFALPACGGDREVTAPEPQGPLLQPLQLRPFLEQLKAMARSVTPPAEAEQRELRELGDLALQLVAADPRTANRAERALLDHPDCWWVLEPVLAHELAAVRRRAAWLCGQSRKTELWAPLLLRLKYELDAETVLWVADALQRLGNDAGLPWLDGAIGVAATAEQAGGFAVSMCRDLRMPLSEPPTWDELRAHLRSLYAEWREQGRSRRLSQPPGNDERVTNRLAAHLATTEGTLLRPIDDARFVMTRCGGFAVPLLRQALRASEPYLRTMALQVLAELGPAAHIAGLDVMQLLGDPLTTAYAVRTLGEIGERNAIPHLRVRLHDADTEIRKEAAQALGLLRDEVSVPALRARLQDQAEAMDVRVGAAFGLSCFGADAEAEAFLAERAAKKDYHEPMLNRLRERLAALRR